MNILISFSPHKKLWEPRDIWVGVFWKKSYWLPNLLPNLDSPRVSYFFYVCILPMFPIQILWFTNKYLTFEEEPEF